MQQLVEDRAALIRVLRAEGGTPSIAKSGGAWLAEKLGRLKPNGHVASYSPLSLLVELEGLAAGIEAKRSMWVALQAAGAGDVEALIERAAEQRERLEPHRRKAATRALG